MLRITFLPEDNDRRPHLERRLFLENPENATKQYYQFPPGTGIDTPFAQLLHLNEQIKERVVKIKNQRR